MSGLGGLNKTPKGVVFELVQLQLPNVVTPDDLAAQTERICPMVAKARRKNPLQFAHDGFGRTSRVLSAWAVDGHESRNHMPPDGKEV